MAENQTIAQRINLYLSEKKIHINEFEKNILVSNGLIGKAIRENRVLGSDKIENILKSYQDISPEWLLTGKGTMLKTLESESPEKLIGYGLKDTPVLSVKALAGIPGLSWEEVSKSEVQLLPGYSFRMQLMVSVDGDSMEPVYKSGDTILISPVLPDEVVDKKVYVLHTDEGTVIKRVVVDRKRKVYMLISDNPYYMPMALNEGQIYAFFRVLCRCEFE